MAPAGIGLIGHGVADAVSLDARQEGELLSGSSANSHQGAENTLFWEFPRSLSLW